MIYTHSICEQGTEIMRTVAEQGRALMIPPGAPDEANELRAALQVIQHRARIYLFARIYLLPNYNMYSMQRAMHRLRKVAARLGCRQPTGVVEPQQFGGAGGSEGAGPSTTHGAGASIEVEEEQGQGEGEGYGVDDQEEIGMSQLGDAPQGTQGASTSGRPQRATRPVERYTPGSHALPRERRGGRRPR
jgi:hypothetical protein